MNAGVGSWQRGMLLGAGTLGGTLGMASGIFIVLAMTTFAAAVLYAISGFGFAVLAAPLFLSFLDPTRAIQLIIIISTVLSTVVLRGLLPAIAPWLLLRLALQDLARAPIARAMVWTRFLPGFESKSARHVRAPAQRGATPTPSVRRSRASRPGCGE